MAATKIRLVGQGILEADLPANSHKITGLADPTAAQDAATKAYVDAAAVGIAWHPAVRAISTTNLTLSGAQTVDGVALIAGDRILVAGQTAGQDNGIYVVAAGSWARATDADTAAEFKSGSAVFVTEGTTNDNTGWVLTTNDPITLGTTALAFAQFSGIGALVAGNGLTKTGSTVDFVALDTSLIVAADSVKVNMAVFITEEVPTGAINGANTTFTLANTPVAGSVRLFQNGTRMRTGAGNDFTISGATITMNTAPLTGEVLFADYIKTP